MESTKKKTPKGLGLVSDEFVTASVQSTEPLTLKLLDEYVSKLVSFERQALVGQELGIQPPMLAALSDMQCKGRSAFKFKKAESEAEKVARIIAPILKKTEES